MTDPARSPAASMAQAILDEEAARQATASAPAVDLSAQLFADDAAGLTARDVFRRGGPALIGVLFALNLVDEFTLAAVNTLAPDIQQSLDISDAVIGVTGVLTGGFLLLGSLPIAVLADRTRRLTVISVTSVVLGVVTALTGAVSSVWQLAVLRIAAGLGKGNHPAYQSLLADAFPIAGRARAFAVFNSANPIAALIGPVLAGGLAALVGGDAGWRWAFLVLALPTIAFGVLAMFQREPERGGNERRALFGEDAELVLLDESPPRMSVAFARLRRIRTFFYFLVGLAAIGYGLFAFPIYASLFLEDRFDLGAFGRGVVLSLGAIGGLAGNAIGGALSDRHFQRDPAGTVVRFSLLILGYVLVVPALYMPNLALFVLFTAVAQAFIGAAFVSFTAVVSAIIPFKLRAQGFALMGFYLFVFGALLGAIITGSISEDHGYRTALTVVVPPPMIIGALIMARGSRFVRDDMTAVVSELEEERREVERIAAGGDVAAVQVRDLDFSYGSLQVLFDVSIDVQEGEVLALLGTNGAGKSTLLGCITGLNMPSRGAVRLNGRTITYADPVERVRAGIVMVPGGKALFPSLTVEENLLVGSYSYVWDDARRRNRRERVLELFPVLAERLDQPAGNLSGGQQQMLAIAKGLLLDPKVLCIDELALGLAPIVVQQLLEVVGELKAEGVTMVIVEQSVNVALSIADRAIFMEKGRVRFQGPARDLLERDDLVRAVFLGGEGG